MPPVDLLFPVLGQSLPTDHAYALFSALCQRVAWLHQIDTPFALAPITGHYTGEGRLLLVPRHSHLRLRLPLDYLREVLPLAGKTYRVMGEPIHLGAPRICPLAPSSSLLARTVTIKHAIDPESFLNAARRLLAQRSIQGRLEVPFHQAGPRQSEARRHVVRIHQAAIICYPLRVHDLTDADSLRLQEEGIGGRRKFGAGMFISLGMDGEA